MFEALKKRLKIERTALPWRRRDFQALFVLLLVLSLIPADFGRYDGVIGRIADAGHFWFYTVISFVAGWRSRKPAAAAFALSAVSGMIEIIQPYVDRDGNFSDFLVSSTGAVTGAWCLTRYSLLWKAFPIFAFSGFLCLPIVSRVYSLEYQNESYPEFAAFDGVIWRELWASNDPQAEDMPTSDLLKTQTANGPALLVKPFPDARWAGAYYRNQEQSWSGYKNLELVVQSEVEQELSIRIDDKKKCELFEDRFNRTWDLKPGENRFVIPLSDIENAPAGRKLEMEKIRRVFLFLGEKPSASGFVIEHLRLIDPETSGQKL